MKRQSSQRIRKYLLSAATLLLGVLAHAQDQTPVPVHWQLQAPRTLVNAGKGPLHFSAHLKALIENGWHIYSTTQPDGGPTKTTIELPEGQPFYRYDEVTAPAPITDYDGNFNMTTEVYTGSVEYRLPIEVQPGTSTGAHDLRVSVRYMTCNDHLCLPAQTLLLHVPVNVLSAAPASELAPEVRPSLSKTAISLQGTTPAVPPPALDHRTLPQASSKVGNSTTVPQRWGALLWLALSMGFLSALTPCVFPLLPITVSYFSQRAQSNVRHRIVDASLFVLGILFTFTALGVLVTLIAGAAGINRFAANPWVNLVLGAAFAVFALSLFGKLTLRLPYAWTIRANRLAGSQTSGHAGVLLMGFVFALTSFTCTAPLIGSLLMMAAQGRWLAPAVGMACYALAFSLPFLVLAMAPSLLGTLPRAGEWMVRLKVVMGMVEFAVVLKFLANADMVWGLHLITRFLCLAWWTSLALLAALYLLRVFTLGADDKATLGLPGLFGASIFFAIAVTFFAGLCGRSLPTIDPYLPPETIVSTNAMGTASTTNDWLENDYPKALALARASGRPVFVDFTGYTCTNCRWMEANIFIRPAVNVELDRFIKVHLYTDGQGKLYEQQQVLEQQLVHTIALPFYVVVNPAGKPIAEYPGLTRKEDEFLSFLQHVK